MKLKKAIKYHLYEYKKAFIIFYCIMISVLTIVAVLRNFTILKEYSDSFTVSGLELATMIFLFVAGLNSFKSEFKFMLQNGISRKTASIAFTISTSVVAIMAVIDIIVAEIIPVIGIEYSSMMYQLFGGMSENFGVLYYIKSFLFLTTTYALVFMVGHIISLLYYRMNTVAKVIVSVLGFIALNISVNISIFNSLGLVEIVQKILVFFSNPLTLSALNIIIFLILSFVSYIGTKNAKIKA